LLLGLMKIKIEEAGLTIYKAANNYSEEYINLLKPYFIAF